MSENTDSAAPRPEVAVKHLKMKPLRRMVEAAQTESKKDSLTGLPNRVALFEKVDIEIVRANRFGHALSIIFIDIDGFKKVNEAGRHLLGDKIMKQLAEEMRAGLRGGIDTLCRYAGDEYVVILPETEIKQAARVGERILQKLDFSLTWGRKKINLGGSLGVVSLTEKDKDASRFIDRADRFMSHAKEESRSSRGKGENILGCIAAGDKITTYNRQGQSIKVESLSVG